MFLKIQVPEIKKSATEPAAQSAGRRSGRGRPCGGEAWVPGPGPQPGPLVRSSRSPGLASWGGRPAAPVAFGCARPRCDCGPRPGRAATGLRRHRRKAGGRAGSEGQDRGPGAAGPRRAPRAPRLGRRPRFPGPFRSASSVLLVDPPVDGRHHSLSFMQRSLAPAR